MSSNLVGQNKILEQKKYEYRYKIIQENDYSLEENNLNIFESERINDVTIIRVNLWEATLHYANSFKGYLDELIDYGNRKIIVNLSYCNSIDSTFWGVLVHLKKRIIQFNGSICLVYNNELASILFMAADMEKVFKIYQDSDTAINSLADRKIFWI